MNLSSTRCPSCHRHVWVHHRLALARCLHRGCRLFGNWWPWA